MRFVTTTATTTATTTRRVVKKEPPTSLWARLKEARVVRRSASDSTALGLKTFRSLAITYILPLFSAKQVDRRSEAKILRIELRTIFYDIRSCPVLCNILYHRSSKNSYERPLCGQRSIFPCDPAIHRPWKIFRVFDSDEILDSILARVEIFFFCAARPTETISRE